MANGKATPRALMEARLVESGLGSKDVRALRLEALPASRVMRLSSSFRPYPALKLPYFCVKGKPTGFYRLRYLGQMDGFDALRKKPMRYVQPPDTTSEAYLPPVVDWPALAKEPGTALFITEGELKAACACRLGFPTIGLGGVWSWRSAKKGMAALPVFDEFTWKGRSVYLVFDSDFSTNPDVMRALVALAKELGGRGAQCYLVALPELPALQEKGKKTGLDDFLVEKGRDEFNQLITEATPFSASEELWKLNGEVVYIRSPGLVIVLADGRKVSPHAFKEHAYSNRHYFETQFDAKGAARLVKKPLAPAWLQWECRAELERLTYAPGRPAVHDNAYNYWPGWGTPEAKKGDVSLWKQLLDYIFGANGEARIWFERWCGYPIQHPGAKLYAASVLWGRTHGTGKSLVGYSLGKVYGRNFSEISDEDLSSSFNEWAENKQFVMGDDVTGQEYKKALMELLKFMITRQKLRVNAKYLPSYEVPDCINYYFTSNHPDSFVVEDTDRRYFVWQMPDDPLPREFYEKYDRWLHSGEAASALLWHFQHMDLGRFNPREPAMDTPAKRAMILDSKNELAAWVAHLAEHPDTVLKLGEMPIRSDLFTTTQLLSLYDSSGVKKASSVWLGRELKKAGFHQANEGAVVLTAKGPQRLYVLRNAKKWIKAKPHELAAHWNDAFAQAAKTDKKSERKF